MPTRLRRSWSRMVAGLFGSCRYRAPSITTTTSPSQLRTPQCSARRQRRQLRTGARLGFAPADLEASVLAYLRGCLVMVSARARRRAISLAARTNSSLSRSRSLFFAAALSQHVLTVWRFWSALSHWLRRNAGRQPRDRALVNAEHLCYGALRFARVQHLQGVCPLM